MEAERMRLYPLEWSLQNGFYFVTTLKDHKYYGICNFFEQSIRIVSAKQRIFTHVNGNLTEAWKDCGGAVIIHASELKRIDAPDGECRWMR